MRIRKGRRRERGGRRVVQMQYFCAFVPVLSRRVSIFSFLLHSTFMSTKVRIERQKLRFFSVPSILFLTQ
jgi:hypothetical protein